MRLACEACVHCTRPTTRFNRAGEPVCRVGQGCARHPRGRKHPGITALARAAGLSQQTLWVRLQHMPLPDALRLPVRQWRRSA